MLVTKEVEVGGKTFSFETGRFAKQADGAVMVRYADTMVLATVVSAKETKEGQDYFPLQVEYREKTSAAGKIPGGFFKREGRPTEKEILSSRLIDRPIRPMFPEGYFNETQVIVTVYSSDSQHDSDVLGACAASAALMVSDAPFDGPIAEVRVGRIDGKFVINPTDDELEHSDLDAIVAGTLTSIVMVEGESHEISESEMVDALKIAHESIKILCQAQVDLAKEIAKAKRPVVKTQHPEALVQDVKKLGEARIKQLSRTVLTKEARSEATGMVYEETNTALAEKYPEQENAINEILHGLEYHAMRSTILEEGKRLDGRGLTDIRKITSEVGVLPRTHGSALFTRGETQSLTTATLGTKLDEQKLEGLMAETTKRFMLHYNFPPFSVGEVGRFTGPGRREIGHGNLAERSLKNLMPAEADFPYTIRIVSDILESNGSSSMATVCAGTLALFDAGVPLKRPIAGIAMGLVKEGDKVAILSDILGNEDHLGDMDFKVTGTEKGITGCQMDLKVEGLTYDVLKEALLQAKEGRLHILGEMKKSLQAPRPDLKPHAPRAHTIFIEKELIGAVIGPGGKVIQDIQNTTGATVVIEEKDKRGIVSIFATNQAAMDGALKRINQIVAVPEVGTVYDGTVKSIMPFGAFVEFMPGKDGLLHISEIKWERLETMDGVMEVGEQVKVKLVEVDKKTGKFRLSRKVLLPKPPLKQEQAQA